MSPPRCPDFWLDGRKPRGFCWLATAVSAALCLAGAFRSGEMVSTKVNNVSAQPYLSPPPLAYPRPSHRGGAEAGGNRREWGTGVVCGNWVYTGDSAGRGVYIGRLQVGRGEEGGEPAAAAAGVCGVTPPHPGSPAGRPQGRQFKMPINLTTTQAWKHTKYQHFD